MALLDLADVTRALIRLLEAGVKSSPAWSSDTVAISPNPPDQLEAGELGVYLYHLSEDAHFKNQPPPGADQPPVRFTPMALDLHYQLSVHPGATAEAAYQAQLLLGLAVKVLHDYPTLTDVTEVVTGNGPVRVFDTLALDDPDNRIRLNLQPVPSQAAVSFWTAGSTPLRPSAYYLASVILLEPEEAASRAGRVLTYGVHTFVHGAPRLDGSENVLSFTPPGAPEREIRVRPAEVPVGGQIRFFGSHLAGEETHLLLRSRRWSEPRQADAPWGVVATAERIVATVQEGVGAEAVLPGVHSAQARVVRRRTMPDGSVRSFEQGSNETPFAITPRIDGVGTPDGDGVLTVEGYVFAHPDLEVENLRVYLGADRLSAGAAGSLEPAEFAVLDAAHLELRLPAGLAAGDQVPLRLLINGAESAPNWIEVPP